MMEAYNLLLSYKTLQSNSAVRLVDNSEEVSFAKVGGDEGAESPRAEEAARIAAKVKCGVTTVANLAT